MQAEDSLPFYLPGDGVYIVGIDPVSRKCPLTEPTLVAEAYRMSFQIQNVDMAAVKAGEKTYNLAKYFSEDEQTLDISAFMGVGTAYDLVVRNEDGQKYQLGQYGAAAPKATRLLAAYDSWKKHETLPLGVYDHWDCALTYDEDPIIKGGADELTVNFGNPHEGLVLTAISFNLVSKSAGVADIVKSLGVKINVYEEDGKTEKWSSRQPVYKAAVKDLGDGVFAVILPLEKPVVFSPLSVTISGLHTLNAWLPRVVDTHNLYPTHTTYAGGQQDKASDVCLNIEGYFNYIGTWGLCRGKSERGEAYSDGDYVQVYYDPSDEDWPGDYYMGEAAFPVECTFGAADIEVVSAPSWIVDYMVDASQWNDYGAIQLSMIADMLPEEVTGRVGMVRFATSDGASFYNILVRQGTSFFDEYEGVDEVIDVPVQGGIFDLMGRRVSDFQRGQVYIQNGKKIMY